MILKMSLQCPAVAVGDALDSRLSFLTFDGIYSIAGDGADGKELGA